MKMRNKEKFDSKQRNQINHWKKKTTDAKLYRKIEVIDYAAKGYTHREISKLGFVHIKQSVVNLSKTNKLQKHDVKFIVTSKYSSKPFDSVEKPLNFVAEFIHCFIIQPRFFAVRFRRHNGYVTKFSSQDAGSVAFISPIH